MRIAFERIKTRLGAAVEPPGGGLITLTPSWTADREPQHLTLEDVGRGSLQDGLLPPGFAGFLAVTVRAPDQSPS